MPPIDQSKTNFAAALSIAILLACCPPSLHADTIVKSPLDKRQYTFFTLPNKLRVLLVSDPATDKAAACVNVHAGYFDDPPEHPGMAHFLEHMLFLGTKKFPAASSYHEFINAHGGRDNASTGTEHTNFYFDIERHSLEPALDRFSQFFIAPLFDRKFMARELNAVNAEYRLKLKDEGRRYAAVMKAAANPKHPFSKFSVGNRSTLANMSPERLRHLLIDFYRQHYSANLMSLTVIGREPLPILKKLVTKYFSAIANRQLQRAPINVPLFLKPQLGTRTNIIPVRDLHQLHLSFPLPWKQSFYKTKPLLLIAFLLGHEGQGSLLSMLKQRGWANRLLVDTTTNAGNYHTMEVVLDLTREGQHHINRITTAVFQYLRLIDKHGLQRNFYDEIRTMHATNFHYREAPSTFREVRLLNANLQLYPPKEVIHGPYAFRSYDQRALHKLLSFLRPENLRLTVLAKGLQTNRRDRWYQTPYQTVPLPAQLIQLWGDTTGDPALRIPEKNPFIPQGFDLKAQAKTSPHPVLLINRKELRLWHKQDDTFLIPKADIMIHIITPWSNDSPVHSMLTGLYLRLVNDHLNEIAYPAKLAGLSYGLNYSNDGISISVSGYDDKQDLLLDVILKAMLTPAFDPQRFTLSKEKLHQNLANSYLSKPYQQLNRELNTLLLHNRWEPDEYLRAMAPLKVKDLSAFIPKLFSQTSVEILAHGNITAREARKLSRHIGKKIYQVATPGPDIPLRVTQLSAKRPFLRSLEIDHNDSGLLVYFQAPADTLRENAYMIFLQQLIKGPFFYLLRTKEQLGYVVFAANSPALRLPGLKFLIESPDKSPVVLRARISAFLKRYPSLLQVMSEEEFSQSKQGLLSRIMERDTSLKKRSLRYFGLLALKYSDFSYQERLAGIIRGISKQDMLKYYQRWILSAQRRQLIIQSPGNHQQMISGGTFSHITDIESFKKGMNSIVLSAP